MPHILVRWTMRDQVTEETEKKPFDGTATYIDFNSDYDVGRSVGDVMSSLSATRVDIDLRKEYPQSRGTYRTDTPPYEVLTCLEYEGYKVVGTHSVGQQHMWTLFKQA